MSNSIYLASDLMKVVRKEKVAPNCDHTLKLHIQQAENGHATALWEVDERFLNGAGVVMGGFVASAADITMAYAISSVLGENQSFTSINLNTTFHRPVLPGEALVEVQVTRLGRQMAYLEAQVYQQEKLAASIVSSVMILDKK